jgi:excisionase family DNA binding protein
MIPYALRMKDAEKYSAHSRTRLYDLIGKGKIAAIKSGKRTLILHTSLEAYLASLPTYKGGA